MSYLTRRRTILAACGGIVTAGCLNEQRSAPNVVLDAAEIRNLDDTAHTVACTIERDGEPVLEKTVDVAARNDGSESVALLGDAFSETEGTYRVRANLEETDADIDATLRPVESACISAEVRITDEAELAVWRGERSGCESIDGESTG